MKITIKQGVDNEFSIDVPNGATVETVLHNADVITICGEQGAARIAGTEVPTDTVVKDGDVIEPVSKANEKAR